MGLPANTSGVFLLVFLSDQTLPKRIYACPCVAGSTNQNIIPSFVGQNYFCETGITNQYIYGLLPQLITLRSGSVVILIIKVLQYNL